MASEYGRNVWDGREIEGSNGHEELLVFGYSCKLFRDNEKATYLDKGNHLIPWMGDDNLMVDRYDVRGALYDLTEAESGGGGNRLEGLSEEEQAEEELCEYERYLALYHDETQIQACQDEESKRLIAELGSDTYAYSQVGFNYESHGVPVPGFIDTGSEQPPMPLPPPPPPPPDPEQEVPDQENSGYFPPVDEVTFIPPPELNVPQGMVVPEIIKQNKIIVKTSKFIAAQGGQMEIVIKTKQAGNPMFAFLSFDHSLNPYYKHMIAMIKSGRYNPLEESEESTDGEDGQGKTDQYLHPALSAGIRPDLTPGTQTTPHKPSPDCAYVKLINKIKEQQKNTAVVEAVASAPSSPAAPVAAIAPVPPPVTSTPSQDTIVENKPKLIADSTPVGSPKVGLVDYPSFNQTQDSDDESDSQMNGSGSEVEEENEKDTKPVSIGGKSEYSNIKWPPPDIQMVIDKMASYIIKNGAEFEAMVHSRGDERFAFLKKGHEYYPYYKCKIQLYSEVYGDIFKKTSENYSHRSASPPSSSVAVKKEKNGSSSKKAINENDSNSNGNGKQSSTISFSIKSREQDVNLDRHSTFPVESSSSEDEDMDEEEREKRRAERAERRRKRKQKEKEDREKKEREERERKEKEEKEKLSEEKEESSEISGDNDDDEDDVYDIFKYAQEMGHGGKTKDSEETKPTKSSTKVGDGDGAGSSSPKAANSKHPEKKMEERRKKAAMFLSRLKKGDSGKESREEEESPPPPPQPAYGPQLPHEITAQLINSASQSPHSSIDSQNHSSRSPSPPMPPAEAPAPPPPPPPLPPPSRSPSPPLPPGTDEMDTSIVEPDSIPRSSWASIPEPPPPAVENDLPKLPPGLPPLPLETTILSGTSEDGRRSQSVESRRSKSRPIEITHREKSRSRKKQRIARSVSRSPSSVNARKERKKRKRSRSRSRRHHKKRRSRSRSPKSRRSHKKKRRKQSSRHERERGGRSEKKSKKSRRRSISSSSSSSSSSSPSIVSSSSSSSASDNDVQVIESPAPSKRESRASSVVSVGPSDTSHLSTFYKIGDDSIHAASPPPLPPIPESPAPPPKTDSQPEKGGHVDALLEEAVEEKKEEKKEEKRPLFDPQNSAAMAKIALGLRAKVHALLDKESKL